MHQRAAVQQRIEADARPKEARTEARSPRSFARLFVLAASSWGRAQLNAVLGVMRDIDSPSALVEQLVGFFPQFSAELEGEDIENYHQVIQRLAPVIAGYLQASTERTVKKFCELVNAMADAGGEKENAISTCLLEHASQVQVRKIIRPHLGAAAKRELR